MIAAYEGKAVKEWIVLLQSGDVAERCAAALALAELGPDTSPAKEALLFALSDAKLPVQVAAQIAIGFVHVPAENRRKMFEHLTSPLEEMHGTVLQSLESLAGSNLFGTAAADEMQDSSVKPAPDAAPAPSRVAANPVPPNEEMPDITQVHVLPWWLLLGAIVLCLGLAWVLRGVWWSKWAMAVITMAAALGLYYLRTRNQAGLLSPKRFRAHRRLVGSIIVAMISGFIVCLSFPTGTVMIDNESGAHVRLLLNGAEWTTIQTGESSKRSLAQGTYRLTVQSMDGNKTLDEHNIEVSAYKEYLLNVLGAQIYFDGIVQYGVNGGSIKPVTGKWIQVPKVDYLFCDPPESIVTVNPVNKSFFTKGTPPNFKRR